MDPFNCFLLLLLPIALLINLPLRPRQSRQWEKYYSLVGFRWQIITNSPLQIEWEGTKKAIPIRVHVVLSSCSHDEDGICLWKYNQKKDNLLSFSAETTSSPPPTLLPFVEQILFLSATLICVEWMNSPQRKKMVIYFDNFSRSLLSSEDPPRVNVQSKKVTSEEGGQENKQIILLKSSALKVVAASMVNLLTYYRSGGGEDFGERDRKWKM